LLLPIDAVEDDVLRLTMPRRAMAASGPRVVLPDEWAYAEIARLDPAGRGDVGLRGCLVWWSG